MGGAALRELDGHGPWALAPEGGDILSDVLRAVRLTGAVYFSVTARAPWVVEAPPARTLAPHIMPGVEHVIEYHVVTAGSCWGGIVGERAVLLEAGDAIVFPQGDAHVMSSAPGMRGDPDEMRHCLERRRPPVLLTKTGDGSEGAKVICGFLGCDARPFNPLLTALPRVLCIRDGGEGDGVIHHFIQVALAESSAPRSGGQTVLARLSELLFIEVVRRHLAALPADQVGWLSGLRDEYVGRALQQLHERPSWPWTLDDLAKEVGLSRSVLAERFTHLVGIPPMQYLAQWRIQLAASLLASTRASLAEVADRVGYGSEAALSRAFKRTVGVAPGTYRAGRPAP